MFRLLTRAGDSLLWVLGAFAALVFVSFQNYPRATLIGGALLVGFIALVAHEARKQKRARFDALMRDAHVPSMSPTDYEQFTARLLGQAGWSVRHVGRKGDQGADVVAELRGFKAVMQCKLYRAAVGSAAVQEVCAARLFYGAQIMVVVCPAGYTASAQALAAANGVHLLHHSALHRLERLARIP